MLQLVSKFICFLIMYTTGYLVIKKIVGVESKINKSTYLYILILAIVSIFLHKAQYTAIYTIMIFLLNIVVYKSVFKLDLSQATIVCAILMMILTIITLNIPVRILAVIYAGIKFLISPWVHIVFNSV